MSDDKAPKSKGGDDKPREDDPKGAERASEAAEREDGAAEDNAVGQPPEGYPKAQESDKVGVADAPDGPDTVKVITEVNPGTAN